MMMAMEKRTRSGVENSWRIEPCSLAVWRCLRYSGGLGHEHSDEDGHDGRHDADGEQAAPSEGGEDRGAQQRGEQHANLEAESHAGGRLGAVGRAGRLGGDGHADAEFRADAHAGEEAEQRHEEEVRGERREQREYAEEDHRIGQHADAAVLVRQTSEHQTAQEGTGQRDGGQRARRGLVDVEAGHDAGHRKAQNHQVKAVERVPDRRGEYRQTGIVFHAAGLIHSLFLCHEHGYPSALLVTVRRKIVVDKVNRRETRHVGQ
ncbi:hypothetical protein [Bifidobacterium sp. SO4]|uniref:hypothetical protein n=1 Tax=Bifidobacterium sp. SO4 TaxID=2809030 RepID=UPI001BDCCBA9|nr:hypothetical protein [Bifidobacterium sp. SO4]MBT1170240.1 hypothetical protein [Bifidobacterium sp. SO4]